MVLRVMATKQQFVTSPIEFEQRCKLLVESLGLCKADEVSNITRLTGGVASDIATVSLADKTVCVKFALEQLRVDEPWFAPVHRGKAEFAWLSVAATAVPDSIPHLYGWSESENGFAMEFIDGSDVYLWKTKLLSGAQDITEAEAVATTIGQIHAMSTKPEFDDSAFDTADDFEQLRIDPYLRFTAWRYPDLAPFIIALADQLSQSRIALVHGDVSPKNILMRGSQPIILDAECASIGDPAFDVAFCLNHLLLKSIHLPESRVNLLAAAQQFWNAYSHQIDWEDQHELEARVVALLPVLLLSRVDGKSTVEYLSPESKTIVREISRSLIGSPAKNLEALFNFMSSYINHE